MSGGSIRAAAKAAMLGGYRSAAAVRRAVLPSSSSSQPPHSSSAADGCRASATIAVDDWVVPDREVFGPVPTHEEAMAATLDLSDAFEIAKSDPKTQAKVAPVSTLPEVVHSETPLDGVYHSEMSKQEDSYESLLATSGAPGRVVQAFTMLNESPEAQDVVASLASDKNVWDAVMKNEKVMKFYKRLETKLSDCSVLASSITEDEIEDDAASSQNSNDFSLAAGESFMDYVERMKALVSEMVANLSSMMQDLVATSNEGRCKGKLKTMVLDTNNDFANAPSAFVLLAIASIMVVLLKRV